MTNRKVSFLVSGNGGTLKFLVEAIKVLRLDLEIGAVIGDRACGALGFAQRAGIDNQQIKYSRKQPTALQALIEASDADYIVTNFHKIIDETTLSISPDKYINLHYSLLPAFGGMIGMDTLKAAKRSNVQFVGASCHQVTKEVDAGKLLGQCALPTNWSLDNSQLMHTVFRGACLVFLNCLLMEPTISPTASLHTINDQEVWFNPGLCFSTDVFDDAFWQAIQSL